MPDRNSLPQTTDTEGNPSTPHVILNRRPDANANEHIFPSQAIRDVFRTFLVGAKLRMLSPNQVERKEGHLRQFLSAY